MGPLSDRDLQQFIERGWCRVERVFDAQQAEAVRGIVWERMRQQRGILREDPTTWPPSYDIEQYLDDPAVQACFPVLLGEAIEQLEGSGRWSGERRWGFWPVNFHYAHDLPGPCPTWGWHVDGNWFRHHVNSPQQGLLVIGLFSDVATGCGGTVVAEGSHRRAARVLAAYPEGLTHRELFDQVLAQPLGNFLELTGRVGDVVLAHPFLFHTRGCKRQGPPRFISNVEAPLREPMCLQRPDGGYSVLERSILDALANGEPPLASPMPCRF